MLEVGQSWPAQRGVSLSPQEPSLRGPPVNHLLLCRRRHRRLHSGRQLPGRFSAAAGGPLVMLKPPMPRRQPELPQSGHPGRLRPLMQPMTTTLAPVCSGTRRAGRGFPLEMLPRWRKRRRRARLLMLHPGDHPALPGMKRERPPLFGVTEAVGSCRMRSMGPGRCCKSSPLRMTAALTRSRG